MGNVLGYCKGDDSTKEEQNEEIKSSINGIDEPDPIIRDELIQAKSTLEKKNRKKWKIFEKPKYKRYFKFNKSKGCKNFNA